MLNNINHFSCPKHCGDILVDRKSLNRLSCKKCDFEILQHGKYYVAIYGNDIEDFLISGNTIPSNVLVNRKFSKIKDLYRNLRKLNSISVENYNNLFEEYKNKKVLIIGGGELGIGDSFINGNNITRLDVYAGPSNTFIADAHSLPFKSGHFDLVVIQAVLEHVLFPEKVVKEIYRVLANEGCVYSEVPFLQSVHEGVYDFQRFTLTGHSFLYRKFKIEKFGIIDGAFVSFIWSIRDILRACRMKTLGIVAFHILRCFSIIFRTRTNPQACNGTFVLARKIEKFGGDIRTLEDLKKYSGLD